MKNLLAVIAAIDPATVLLPTSKVEKGEKVVGVLTDDLKRVLELTTKIAKKLDEDEERKKLIDELEAVSNDFRNHVTDAITAFEKSEEIKKKIEVIEAEYHAIKVIFWKLIDLEFGTFHQNARLREGGKVVIVPSIPKTVSAFDALMGLAGVCDNFPFGDGFPAFIVSRRG